jgi:L-asparaginase
MELQVAPQKIVILGTGGTIAGLSRPGKSGGYDAARLGVEDLLLRIPSLAAAGLSLVSEQVAKVDSKDMETAIWQRLLARCMHWLAQDDVAGLVVTHGTDTLEETAYFLHHVLSLSKPVIFTCAMRPADAVDADGPQNLHDAIVVASMAGARGVLAVCAGQVHSALDVQKIHPTRVDAFSSGDAGELARVDKTGQITMVKDWPQQRAALSMRDVQRVLQTPIWPRVEIITSHAGADGALLQDMLSAQANSAWCQSPLKGVVVAATGNGTIHHRLEKVLLSAQTLGVRVAVASRCALGQGAVTPFDAPSAGLGLSPVKARIALMVELLLAAA